MLGTELFLPVLVAAVSNLVHNKQSNRMNGMHHSICRPMPHSLSYTRAQVEQAPCLRMSRAAQFIRTLRHAARRDVHSEINYVEYLASHLVLHTGL